MKYLIRYFTILLTALASVSCLDDNLEIPSSIASKDAQFQIVGRITRFDDQYVDTRANKNDEEAYVSSMALAVFPIVEGSRSSIGDCISYTHLTGNNFTFTIDRNEIPVEYNNKPFVLYIFANMPTLPHNFADLEDKSLEYFMSEVNKNSGIRRPQTGFPMVGSLGDTVSEGGDNTEFILKPVNDNKTGLPTVGGVAKDYIPIPMKALYSKFSFEISVVPDQHMVDGVAPMFSMKQYTIHNIPAEVCVGSDLNQESTSGVLSSSVTVPLQASSSVGSVINFDFYLPERFLTPQTSASNFYYPLGENSTPVKGYENVRPEDQKYCQRFKAKLLEQNQKATYITIEGKFRDHQNHNFDVTYDIYLGGDNYGNFDIVRNTNYVNSIVIRGVKASDDQTPGSNVVSIDHRVNVVGSLPIVVNLHRETQLDSHFEVRPLRVHYPLGPGESLPAEAKVTVEILNANTPNETTDDNRPDWIRIEHNNGDGFGDDIHCANGKRRYFTTDLVTNTLQNIGKSVPVNLSGGNQETFWLYVDENDDPVDHSNPNAVRKAIVRVTYSDENGVQDPLDYVICQYQLYPVVTQRKAEDVAGTTIPTGEYTYYIEHEEEYLHNYDSEDSFGMTENAGMEWGLEGIQLSHIYKANYFVWDNDSFEFSSDLTEQEKENILNKAVESLNITPKYDFYLSRDTNNENLTIRSFSGYEFNKESANYLIEEYGSHQGQGVNAVAKIDGIALDEQPKSAFAYCYNRNKRQPDGKVADKDMVWYLPAIDEIEDIMEYAYGDFDTEFQGNMYWSCQPSYVPYTMTFIRYRYWLGSWSTFLAGEEIDGQFYVDDLNQARATKALRQDGVFVGVPDSGADVYINYNDGKIYISSSNVSKNKTAELGTPNIENENYNDISKHPGNKPRTGKDGWARVRCVRKMN